MRLIPTHRAPDRALLGRDVESGDPDAAPLLRAGMAIDARQRELLLRAGIRAIWIDDELSRGIEPAPLLSPDTRREASLAVGAALDEARAALGTTNGLSTEAVAALSRATMRIRDDVLSCPDTARALLDLSADHEFPHGDAAGVAALGMRSPSGCSSATGGSTSVASAASTAASSGSPTWASGCSCTTSASSPSPTRC